MPAANLFTTKAIQDVLVKKIQGPIVSSFEKLTGSLTIIELIQTGIELIKVIRQIRKLPKPTHDNVNKHNTHILVSLREWFLEHEAPNSSRYKVFDGILRFVAMKYDFDDYFSRRFDKWLEKWKETDWMFTGKHPATAWKLNEADQNEPVVQRQKALLKALNARDFGKVLGLIE